MSLRASRVRGKAAAWEVEEEMIKTVIFDIGNVLAGFAWEEYFFSFGYPEEIFQRLKKATVGSSAWQEHDRGALTDDEILELFVKNDPGIEKELKETLGNIKGMVVKYDYAIPWVKELKKKGYQVLVLSNFAAKAYRDCRDALGFLDYVDGGILSFRDKVVKPEPEIYRLLLERYHLDPEECVFLDDTEKNLLAAGKFGIHTIHFINKDQALEELRRLGVE